MRVMIAHVGKSDVVMIQNTCGNITQIVINNRISQDVLFACVHTGTVVFLSTPHLTQIERTQPAGREHRVVVNIAVTFVPVFNARVGCATFVKVITVVKRVSPEPPGVQADDAVVNYRFGVTGANTALGAFAVYCKRRKVQTVIIHNRTERNGSRRFPQVHRTAYIC